MSRLLKNSVNLTVGFCLFLTAFGFYALQASPYTGLILSYADERAYVQKVDRQSPGYTAGIRSGDSVVQVNNSVIPFPAFLREPSEIKTREDWRIFWKAARHLEQSLQKDRPLELLIEQGGARRTVSIVPGKFPFFRILSRTILLDLAGWTCLLIGYLVIRKKSEDMAVANFIACSAAGAGAIAFAPYLARDLSFGFTAFKFLSTINNLGALVCLVGFVHFVLVFPRRKKIMDKHPNLVPVLYGVAVFIPCAVLFELLKYPSHAVSIPFSACAIFIFVTIVSDFFREKDLVYRKQIQWVALGFSGAATAMLSLYSLPLLLGMPPVPEEIVTIPVLMAPVSLAFAITRYRLMDIDNIFDQAVIYGSTILILQSIELSFFGTLMHFYRVKPEQVPYLLFFAVLLIVFLYTPLRIRIKDAVERVFKRGTYNIEEELQAFALSAGVCNGSSSLEKFESHITSLLGPSGVYLEPPGRARASYSESRDLRAVMLPALNQIAVFFENSKAPCFGYELADRNIARDAVANDSRLASSLFVPFFVEGQLCHIAILLPKSNGTAYSKKDQALLNALSANVSHMLDAEEKKYILEKERTRIAREIHDGISSEFTGIISHADKADQYTSSNDGQIEIKTLIEKIKNSSRRGVQELRNIVWAMSPERQSVGFLAAYIKRFSSDFLGSVGIKTAITQDLQDEEKMISPQALLTVFRTIQEACHNIVKHSGANFVRIALQSEGEWLKFSIEDNGKGFDPPTAQGGLGLQNMKRRAEETGGEFSISSPPGSGTILKAKFRVTDQYPVQGY